MQNSTPHLNQLLLTNRIRPYRGDDRATDQLRAGARFKYCAPLKRATTKNIMELLREIVACCRVAVLLAVMFLVLGGIILWEAALDAPVVKMEASE